MIDDDDDPSLFEVVILVLGMLVGVAPLIWFVVHEVSIRR